VTLEQAEWKRLKEVETDMRSTIKEEENTGCDKKEEEEEEEEENITELIVFRHTHHSNGPGTGRAVPWTCTGTTSCMWNF